VGKDEMQLLGLLTPSFAAVTVDVVSSFPRAGTQIIAEARNLTADFSRESPDFSPS
jgi:hypothetical protein